MYLLNYEQLLYAITELCETYCNYLAEVFMSEGKLNQTW